MKYLQRYKDVFLLKSGVVVFCCTLIIFSIILIFDDSKFNDLSRSVVSINFFAFALTLLVIAPIFEEIIFRGAFLKQKIFTFISFLGILVYIIVTNNYYLILLLLITIYLFAKGLKFTKTFYFTNAILFSLVHYQINDFNTFYHIIPMFFQFSLGLVLTWVVLNFNLLKSIIIHFCFNLIIVLVMIVPLQFPDQNKHIQKHNGFVIEWQKVPLINMDKKMILVEQNGDYIYADNITIHEFFKLNDLDFKDISPNQDYLFYKLKINIYQKEKTELKLDENIIKELLIKTDLVFYP